MENIRRNGVIVAFPLSATILYLSSRNSIQCELFFFSSFLSSPTFPFFHSSITYAMGMRLNFGLMFVQHNIEYQASFFFSFFILIILAEGVILRHSDEQTLKQHNQAESKEPIFLLIWGTCVQKKSREQRCTNANIAI